MRRRDQSAFGIAEHRPHPHRSAAGVDLVVDELQMTFEGRAIAGGGDHLHRNAVDLHVRIGSERLERTRDDFLVRIEACIDRVHRDQRREHRSAGTRRDQIPDCDLELTHASGDRRTHLRVVEVKLRGLQRRLGGPQVAFGLAIGADPLVDIAFRDRARVRLLEPARAVLLLLCKGQPRLGGEHLRLGAVDLGRVRLGIDGDERIALLHKRTFAEMDGLDGTGNPRAHFHTLNRLKPARKLVPQGDIALLDDRN